MPAAFEALRFFDLVIISGITTVSPGFAATLPTLIVAFPTNGLFPASSIPLPRVLPKVVLHCYQYETLLQRIYIPCSMV